MDGAAAGPGGGEWEGNVAVKGQGGGELGWEDRMGQSLEAGLITWATVVVGGLVGGAVALGVISLLARGEEDGGGAPFTLVMGGGRGGGVEVATDLTVTVGAALGEARSLLGTEGRGGGEEGGGRTGAVALSVGGCFCPSASQAITASSASWMVSSFSLRPKFLLAQDSATLKGPPHSGSGKPASFSTSLSIRSA